MSATNERLKAALADAGITPEELAERIQVDPKTVRRWLTGRAPYPRHRTRIAQALGVGREQLWPEDAPDSDAAATAGSELIEVHTGADHDGADWRALLADAQRRVDLLDLTLVDVIAEGDGPLLAAAAKRGCHVRVLLSDRDSVHLAIAEQELGRNASLTNRPAITAGLDRVRAMLTPHVQHREIELRTFVGAGPYQVLTFDDHTLVRLRIAGVESNAAPVLRLNRQTGGGIFDGFSRHFEALWRAAETPH